MTNSRFPIGGSGRLQEGGRLATDKQDFNAHVGGNGFRHTADQVDLLTAIPGVGGSTVQQALSSLNSIISSSGSGFISIGKADGYAQGVYNVGDLTTPTLASAFAAAVTNPRLANGGVILLLAGTYTTSISITVPAGISVIGEVEGTLIIGEMTEQPIFVISKTGKHLNVGGDAGGGPITLDTGSNVDSVRFFNLMLADNLNGVVASDGPSMTTVPMIQCQISSNFSCERVTFLGKVANGAVTGRGKTLAAIGYTTGGGTGTTLTVKECFLDGFKTGINFSPNNGNIDFLTVDGCKARIYGTETGASPSPSVNSFIVSTLCNAAITNNYFVGAGSQAKTLLDITSASINTTVLVKVIGNSGSPSGGVGNLVHNDSGITFTSIITGNNWGIAIENPWYIVVGGADGDTPLGDIFGPNAINTVLTLAASSQDFQATIVVNPGTYTVTGNSGSINNANIKFVGNKKGKKYPVFSLNLTYTLSLDVQGNKYINLGNHIESIQFTSVTLPQSVFAYPDFFASVANTAKVIDCIFDNTSLGTQNLPNSGSILLDNLGLQSRYNIEVSYCNFFQSGDFSDRVSCFLPSAHNVSVHNCNFWGSGYSLSIGTPGYANSFVLSDCIISIKDCCLNLDGSNIRAVSPLGNSFSNYICINNSTAMVVMDNCQIYVDSSFDPASSPIDPGVLSGGNFDAFTKITASDITINNCLINGPADSPFTSSSVNYALPAMVLSPSRSGRVVNSKFITCGFPLQFTGSNIFSDTTNRDGIYVDNCLFTTEGIDPAQTCLDIDLNILSAGSTPHVSITNNTFKSTSATGSVAPIKHYNFTGSLFKQNGIVEIWADKCFVTVSHNNIVGNLWAAVAGGYTDYSGLVVDTFETTSDSGTIVTSAQINNNSIVVLNNFSTSTATNSASNLWIKGLVSIVNDNYFQMVNQASLSSSFIGNLQIDARATTTGTYSDSLVSSNIFSRRTQAGATSSLLGGYVKILSTSKIGRLFNNNFSDPTIDGSSTVIVLDQTTEPNKWNVFNNRNQTRTMNIQGFTGRLSNANNTLGNPQLLGNYPTNLTISGFDVEPASNTLVLGYTSATTANFDWHLPLQTLLPDGVRIISVTVSGNSSANFNLATFSFTLEGNGLTTATGTPTLDFTSGSPSVITSVITPSNSSATTTFNNTPVNGLKVKLNCLNPFLGGGGIQNGSSQTINFTAVTIVYRWM